MTDEFTEPLWATSALLTIDLQRDFLSDGPHAVAGTSEILPNVIRLIEAFRAAGRPIVHVVRLYVEGGSNAELARRKLIRSGTEVVKPGTRGAELAPGLIGGSMSVDASALLGGGLQKVGPEEYVMFKPRWNAFFGTALEPFLRSRGLDTVAVAGCNYPNCPRATFFGASERDFRAAAVTDAISRWRDDAESDLASIGVTCLSTSALIEALAALG